MSRPVVLNTRPSEQASELTRCLLAAGLAAVEAPAIAIVPAWDAHAFEQTRRALRDSAFAWVVVASPNAGRGLATELRAQGTRVVCGAATAAALGLAHARTLERFSAAAALDALRVLGGSHARVLVPRAAEGREELVDGLRELGMHVVAPVAYRTVPTSAAATRLRQGDVDVLTLCSPSAANAVAGCVPERTLAVCLGRTTADAARGAGLRVDCVADRPDMAALVSAIRTTLSVRV